MRDADDLFAALKRSHFRRRFALGAREIAQLDRLGMRGVRIHARRFIDERLAPTAPANDGRQTPMRNHPVFIAQHATATCCRGCLARWHDIPVGRALGEPERQHVLAVIERWLRARHEPAQQDLFNA